MAEPKDRGSKENTLDAGLRNLEPGQLSRLSSVLNGLEGGARAMCRHTQDAMKAVQSGTYRVDPIQLSRRIVGDALGTR